MMEGDNEYFEDINIFNNIENNNHIIFSQVKGTDSNSNNNTSVIKKAMFNFIKNKNIENIRNFTFLVMTNKGVQNYFYNKTINDKENLIEFFINDLDEIKNIANTGKKSKIKNYILIAMKKNLKRNACFINNMDYSEKNKRMSFFKDLDSYFYKKLNKILLLILNMKVIDFIDYKVIIYLLNEICEKDEFLNLLWKVELISMNREDILEKELKDKIVSINFDTNLVEKLKFSDEKLVKYGKIF